MLILTTRSSDRPTFLSQPMKSFDLFTWIIFFTIAIAIFLMPPSVFASDAGTRREVRIYAGDFGYSPPVLRVNPGDTVVMELISTDVAHGFSIDEYGVNVTAYPGQPETISFVADKAGSFRVRCTISCGTLHPFMIGKLIVGKNFQLIKGSALLFIALLVVVLQDINRSKVISRVAVK